MKKIMLMVLIGIFCFSFVYAQEFHTTNQATIDWEQDLGGIPAAEVKWNVYLANAITDPGKTNPVKIGNAVGRPYTITLNVEGKYYVGVSAVRTISGTVVGETDILWADTQTEVPAFGLQYFTIPPMPTRIIKQ
jgi:hypothetical protein